MKPRHGLDAPHLRRWLVSGGVVALAGLLVAELLVHHHARFGVEASFGFHAWYGLLSGIGVVVLARVLALLLRRGETYYED